MEKRTMIFIVEPLQVHIEKYVYAPKRETDLSKIFLMQGVSVKDFCDDFCNYQNYNGIINIFFQIN